MNDVAPSHYIMALVVGGVVGAIGWFMWPLMRCMA